MRRVSILFSLFLLVALASRSFAGEPTTPAFSKEQLEQILAPIALYPDSLLSQVFMASTYPLEVVEAARWSSANAKVTGDAAVKAVEKETWDPSVKSLVAFPTVLTMMNDKLEWTQQLGDAFLGQQGDVMNTVQALRKRAQQAGQLASTEQQKVVTQNQTIIIQPAHPQVVYVPSYNPTVVYGPWPYPAYPPVYFPPPPGYVFGSAVAAGIGFGVGIAVTNAIFGNCDWGRNEININVNRYNNINVNNINVNNRTNINNTRVNNTNVNNVWQHDAAHRRGVAYRDQTTQSRYAAGQARSPGGIDARRDYRGFDSTHSAAPVSRTDAAPREHRDAAQVSRAAAGVSATSALSASPNQALERSAASRGYGSTHGMDFHARAGGGGSFARRH